MRPLNYLLYYFLLFSYVMLGGFFCCLFLVNSFLQLEQRPSFILLGILCLSILNPQIFIQSQIPSSEISVIYICGAHGSYCPLVINCHRKYSCRLVLSCFETLRIWYSTHTDVKILFWYSSSVWYLPCLVLAAAPRTNLQEVSLYQIGNFSVFLLY